MTELLFKNFVWAQLTEEILESATVALVDDLSRFPAISPTQAVVCSLYDGEQEPEIVWVRGLGTMSLAIERAKEGTTAKIWPKGTRIFSVLTAEVLASLVTPASSGGGVAISAGTQSASSGTVAFVDSGGVTFGLNGSSLTASVKTDYALSTHTHGTPTLALTNLSGTLASASSGLTVSLSAADPALKAGTGVTTAVAGSIGISGTLNTAGLSISASVPNFLTTAALSNHSHGFSAGGGSSAFQTLSFSNGGGVTFTNSAGQVAATIKTDYAGQGVTTAGANVGLSGTLSTNGLSLSVTAPAQTNQSLGIYALGNTTGQSSSSTRDARSLSISGLGIASVGMSAGILLVSVPAGGGGGDGVNILAAGTQTANTTGTVNFADSNGVTFGMSASSQITASVRTDYASSNHSHGNPTLALTNLSGTTASNSTGLTLSLSAAAPGGGGNFSAGVSNIGDVLGNTGITGTRLVFAGINGISLSQSTDGNGATISLLEQVSYPPQYVPFFGTTGGVVVPQGQLNLVPLAVPFHFSFTEYEQLMSISLSSSSNSSHAAAVTLRAALYSQTGSSWSLMSSGSQSYQWTNSSNVSMGSVTGMRKLTVPLTITGAPNAYALAYIIQTATTNANWATLSYVTAQAHIGVAPQIGAATAASLGLASGFGGYSATTTAFPNSIAFSQVATQSVIRAPAAAFAG